MTQNLHYNPSLQELVDHVARHIAKSTISSSTGRSIIAKHLANSIVSQYDTLPNTLAPIVMLLSTDRSEYTPLHADVTVVKCDGISAAQIILNQTAHNDPAQLQCFELIMDILNDLSARIVKYKAMATLRVG